MESWGPGGPPTALLLCSRVTVLAGALVSHVLTHGGWPSTPALASPDTTHTPCLHGACGMTTRRCPPYPVSEDTAFPPDVPELDVCVLGTRGYELAIRVKIQAADVGFVSHECAKNFGSFQVPDADGARLGAGHNELLRGVEADTLHRGRVTRQAHDAVGLVDGP